MNRADVRHEANMERRLSGALQAAFERDPDLRPAPGFTDGLREQLRQAAAAEHRSSRLPRRWTLAAGIMLAAGLTGGMFTSRFAGPAEALAREAAGDHRNCALKFRLVRAPVPLEEAARRFDSAYRLLLTAPPDDIPAPGGVAHVIDRHACAYGARRFGHVIMQYRGRVVSLLMTANDSPESVEAVPHVIGHRVNGLSAVSVTGSRHSVVMVSDLSEADLMQLSGVVSPSLLQSAEQTTAALMR
jgi:hypothetical protein